MTTTMSQEDSNRPIQIGNGTTILGNLDQTILYETTISNLTTMGLYGTTNTTDLNKIVPWAGETDTPLSTYIMFGLTCAITFLGLFGNSLILAVVKSQKQALKPHDILISALALFDGLALLVIAISHPSVYAVLGTDIRAITTAGCKLFTGTLFSFLSCSFTVIVLICVERFICVWWPFRARHLLTRRLTNRVLCISVTVSCLVYISMSVLYSEIADGKCDPNLGGTLYSTVLKEIPDTTVYSGILVSQIGLYMAMLFTLTPMIIVKLYKQKQIRQQLTAPEQNIGHFKSTVKLTSVLVSFIVLTAMPGSLFVAISRTGFELTDESQTLPAWLILMRLLQHSINILLYSMLDLKFRSDAFSLFHRETIPLVTPNVKSNAETSFAQNENQN